MSHHRPPDRNGIRTSRAGLSQSINLTCADHKGHRPANIHKWHPGKWLKLSGRIQTMTTQLQPAHDFAENELIENNPSWSLRELQCEKSL